MFSRGNYKDKVWPLPVSALLYVGRHALDKLSRLGVYTIGDLAVCDPAFLHGVFGKMGDTLLCYARGEDDEPVRPFYEEREVKSVGNSMTFAHNLVGEDECRMGADRHCATMSAAACGGMRHGVPDRAARHPRSGIPQPLAAGHAGTPDQFHARADRYSMALLRAHWQIGRPIRLLSVTAANLLPEAQSCEQLSCLTQRKRGRRAKSSAGWTGRWMHCGSGSGPVGGVRPLGKERG